MDSLEGASFLEGWLSRKGILSISMPRKMVAKKARITRLAWADWMIEQIKGDVND
jgi:hypothetical protein